MTARGICVAALACAAVTFVGAVVPLPTFVGAPAVLIFWCWVPGVAFFAIVGAWHLVRSPAAAMITSLSLLILFSQVALLLHLWSPRTGTGILAVLSAVLLLPAVCYPRAVGAAR